MNTKKLNAGFSLVELMVVVAIIGILATIAVPNYLKFQAKARQSNAKAELAGIYTSEKSFFVEYNSYYASLPMVGYVPEGVTVNATNCPNGFVPGKLRFYRTGFTANGAVFLPQGLTDTCGGGTQAAAPGAAANVTYYDISGANTGLGSLAWATAPSSGVPAAATFTAVAHGLISNAANQSDVWTITEANTLTNVRAGL